MTKVQTAVPAHPGLAAFIPPRVEVGQAVLWSYGGDPGRVSPALVLAVGQRTLSLAVHVDGVHDHVLKTGVRHRADPFLATAPQHDAGVWERTERDIRLDILLARFEGDT